MPKLAMQRRMGDKWGWMIERASVAAQAFPPEGVSRSEFADLALLDVEPGGIDEALKALHARKVVWVSRRGGIVRVYRERPPAELLQTSETTTPLGRFVSAVVPHFYGLALAERDRAKAWAAEDWKANDAAHEAIRANVHRILGICRAHVARGLSVEAIRNVLHGTFAEDALAALAYHEPRLQRGALDEDLDPPKSGKPKRAPKGLDLDSRVLRLIRNSGEAGVTLTTLGRGIRPAMPAAAIREATERLAASGRIVKRMVKPAGVGRPGERCFRVEGATS